MESEKKPIYAVDILENTWTAINSEETSKLLVSAVEPCVIFCVYFPDQVTYFGHFNLPKEKTDESEAQYPVLGFDPTSMSRDIEDKLVSGKLNNENAQVYVYGGGEVAFEDESYNNLVRENFEHVADLANSLEIPDQNKHLEPLPLNTNMFFSINSSTGEIVVDTQPSRD